MTKNRKRPSNKHERRIFQKRNPFAKFLEEDLFRQRIVDDKKKRQKLSVRNIQTFEEDFE